MNEQFEIDRENFLDLAELYAKRMTEATTEEEEHLYREIAKASLRMAEMSR